MRNLVIENLFDERGYDYDYVSDLDGFKIDEEASINNQARLDPIVSDRVDEYARRMKAGDQFPAIVVFPMGENVYLIGDGNHRYQARIKRNKETTIDAYVVRGLEAPQRLQLIFELNTYNGVPNSDFEREQHALSLIGLGMTASDAAKVVNMPDSRIQQAVVDDKGLQVATRLGVSRAWKSIPARQTRYLIQKAGLTDPVFKAVVELVARRSISTAVAKEVLGRVTDEHSESARVRKVQEIESEYRQADAEAAAKKSRRKGNPAFRNPVTLFKAKLSSLQTGSDTDVAFSKVLRQLTDDERNELRGEVEKSIRYLAGLEKVLS